MKNDDYLYFKSEEFLNKLFEREEMAVSKLVKAYTQHLYKAALGMGLSEEKAHDVTHSCWLTFFEILDRFEKRSHVRTFLFGILYHKVSEQRRSNMKFENTDPIETVIESQFKSDGHWAKDIREPSDQLEGKEAMSIIEKCLEHLPDLQKSVFMMKVVQEFDSDEICDALNIKATHLRQLLFRGRNRMKDCVERNMK